VGFSCSELDLAGAVEFPVEEGDVIVLPAAEGRFPI